MDLVEDFGDSLEGLWWCGGGLCGHYQLSALLIVSGEWSYVEELAKLLALLIGVWWVPRDICWLAIEEVWTQCQRLTASSD